MRHYKFMLFILMGLSISQCTDLGEPIISPVDHGNFVLYVMMESLRINPVDVQVYIDGRRAVSKTFPWNNERPEYRFEFQIEEGKHTLRATSSYASGAQSIDFMRSSTPYAVVTFWSDPQPAFLTIDLFTQQPTFADERNNGVSPRKGGIVGADLCSGHPQRRPNKRLKLTEPPAVQSRLVRTDGKDGSHS